MPNVVVKVLNEDNTPKTPEQIESEKAAIVAAGNIPVIPGSDTDPALLLSSLQQERAKIVQLEKELEILKGSPASLDVTSEEGRVLAKEIHEAKGTISHLTQELARKDLIVEFPVLKDHTAEFDKYLADPENAGMSLKTAAKAFMVENNLGGNRRPGLEKPTGGDRQPPSTGMTIDDIRTLRETNFKKYQELLSKGLIKFN